MSNDNLKDIIKQEFLKCAADPAYFMNKYCSIQHPTRGKIPFVLYEYQRDTLHQLRDNDYNIVLKARQLGISTLSAGYALWMMTFHSDKNILVVATKQDTAKNLVTKVRFMHSNLPTWLRNACTEDNKLSLKYSNGSQIKAVSSSEDAGRSEALSLLILDEAAFIDKIDIIWGAAQQTLATGGQCIAISTPNGIGNWYHNTWIKAEAKENKFNPIKLHWTLHPERTQEWRDEQDTLLGPSMAEQECDCDFLSSGTSVVDAKVLQWYKDEQCCEPIEKRYVDSNLWIWEQPDYDKDYIVTADVARGDGEDYSAFHIIEVQNVKQVAEYKGQIPPKDFGNLCMNLATEYNNALLIIENNSIGWAAIQAVIDREYDNLFYTSKDLKYVDVQRQLINRYRNEERKMVPGFTTTMRTRPLVIAKIEEFVRLKEVTINSGRLIDELFTFVYNNNKAEALRGYNDDLVMAYGIGLWVRDTALRLKAEGIQLNKKTLEGFNSNQGIYTQDDTGDNGFWDWDNGREKEDLTWLINDKKR
tara:strand:- start:54 stop:1643 length:1590 start_codon:yes stop_codon:yes gene_type:complete